MNSFQLFQSITSDCTCCICGRELTMISDFCDPTPLHSEENAFACRECFHTHVVKARALYIDAERDRIYHISSKKESVDPYLKEESPENGIVRLIRYQGVIHHTPERYVLACTEDRIPTRGKAARSARMGVFSDLNCPECRAKLLKAIPELASYSPDD